MVWVAWTSPRSNLCVSEGNTDANYTGCAVGQAVFDRGVRLRHPSNRCLARRAKTNSVMARPHMAEILPYLTHLV